MANETITGKIFTLKDSTGTYNRFPRTVMEAVYGLNTYLQNQFSALADIYMPIEGITESKPLQEFVYRLCPSSIKAKSVSLDRIYGKTLAWNQLVNSVYNGSGNGITWAAQSDGSIIVNGTSTASLYRPYAATNQFIAGHKYLYSNSLKSSHYGLYDPAIGISISGSGIFTPTSSGSATPQFFIGEAGVVINNEKVFTIIIDLTLLYGSEIDGMTNAEILAKFESEFPGYHDYEPGKLISNDAESVETVGFNQWDEVGEVGNISSVNGENSKSSQGNNWRSVNYIPVIAGATYYCKSDVVILSRYYDSAKNYIGLGTRSGAMQNRTFVVPDNASYLRFVTSALPTAPICINLSDPAKNGTYEPYRKSVMQLGLAEFQVRDSQGNVTTIEGGLKSAGSVRDEIVGNKYIKRVGEVDLGTLQFSYNSTYSLFICDGGIPLAKRPDGANDVPNLVSTKYTSASNNTMVDKDKQVNIQSNVTTVIRLRIKDSGMDGSNIGTDGKIAALSGSMLYYELATPIEYELVSPLVPTVKAGETEARISPNSDGLSAPMVADMTYDANANNDSASAQYALSAGRLLNSHKLWGQDFDGTQDVSGALTGVTTINMSGQLTSSVATGNAPFVVASTTEVANLHAYTATKLHTARTIWGRSFDGTGNVSGALTGVTSITMNGALSGVTTLSASGAVTLGSTLSATGAATLGSTLTVTGLTSIAGGLKLTTTKKIWFDDTHYIELLNGYLHTNLPFVSDSYITAGAANTNS